MRSQCSLNRVLFLSVCVFAIVAAQGIVTGTTSKAPASAPATSAKPQSTHASATTDQPKPTSPPTPKPTHAPPTVGLPPNILSAIGQMQQYDIEAFIIKVPAQATVENPTVDGITYPAAAIEYGLWFNETAIAAFAEQKLLGSLFNSPVSMGNMTPPNADWWRALQNRLYEISSANNGTPFLYGLDSVHGVNYAFGATLFPQSIGTAATFDRQTAFNVGNITGRESRYIGIPWAFAPILGIAVQPSWARVYETFGEDPLLTSEMGVHDILGMQQPPPPEMFPELCKNGTNTCPQSAIAACMKHFIGYSDTRTGRDRTPAWIPDNMLMQYFVPPFQAAAAAGVLSTMENYIQVNGQPVVSSSLYLRYLLRQKMLVNFQGMLVTDYNEIYELHDFHNATGSYKESVQVAINDTTIDMGMFATPNVSSTFTDNLAQVWREGKISDERLAESLARILSLKSTVGLDNNPVPPQQSVPLDSYKLWNSTPAGETCFFGCPEHHAMALEATLKSMTLLQNDGILPLKSSTSTKVAVIGQGCNSVPIMAGGWTIHWQGSTNPADFPYGSTVLQELATHFEIVSYAEGCNITEQSICDPQAMADAVSLAESADLAVVCVGESQYAEVVGDITDLTLPGMQIQLVEQIAVKQKNIITVLIEGRPRVLKTIPNITRAVLMAYLPGPFGGRAIVDTLMGINNPSGRLPISYPKHLSTGPIQYWRAYSANEFDDYSLQWTFGTGLSYTEFKYSGLKVQLSMDADIHTVSVNVTNIGSVPGFEVVSLFTTQAPRPMPAEVKRLRNFTRVFLQPGETQTVEFYINILSLTFRDQVNCEWLAFRPTYVTIGFEDPFVVDGHTAVLDLGSTDGMGLVFCPFAQWYAKQDFIHSFVTSPSPPAPPEGEAKDYFMSSVVCFVGGVIATCFLVFFVRKRNRYLRPDVQLFEPSGV